MTRHDWYIGYEQQIIDLYAQGFGANHIIKTLELPCTDSKIIHRFLRKRGIEIRKFDERINPIVCPGCDLEFVRDAWNQKVCKTCTPTKVAVARFFNYGITQPQFDQMLIDQNHMCDLCGKPLPENQGSMRLDHCHVQGHARGILHNKCNIGLHYIEDKEFIGMAVRYVEKHRR